MNPSELSTRPDCLLVFLDETGHEHMPDGHDYYGIGGCAIMARDYDPLIRFPWREFRRQVTGSVDGHLHAAQFGRNGTPDQLEKCAQFFRTHLFMRIGGIGSRKMEMPTDPAFKEEMRAVPEKDHRAWIILRAFLNRIIDVAKWTQFRSVAIIVEANPRSKRLRQSVFGSFNIEEFGLPIPVDLYEMNKSAGEPGLEVADFIANTMAGHARHSLVEGKDGFRRDFKAVFHGVSDKFASYMGVEKVEFTPGPSAEGAPTL